MNNIFKRTLVVTAITLLSGCTLDDAANYDATPHVQAFTNHVTNATQTLDQTSDRVGKHVESAMNAASNHTNNIKPEGKVAIQHGSHSFNSDLNTDKDNFHSNTSFSSNGYSASMQGHHSESASGSSTGAATSMTVPSMNHSDSPTTISSNANVNESPAGTISAAAGATAHGLN